MSVHACAKQYSGEVPLPVNAARVRRDGWLDPWTGKLLRRSTAVDGELGDTHDCDWWGGANNSKMMLVTLVW